LENQWSCKRALTFERSASTVPVFYVTQP
jgi:hypothetical protein